MKQKSLKTKIFALLSLFVLLQSLGFAQDRLKALRPTISDKRVENLMSGVVSFRFHKYDKLLKLAQSKDLENSGYAMVYLGFYLKLSLSKEINLNDINSVFEAIDSQVDVALKYFEQIVLKVNFHTMESEDFLTYLNHANSIILALNIILDLKYKKEDLSRFRNLLEYFKHTYALTLLNVAQLSLKDIDRDGKNIYLLENTIRVLGMLARELNDFELGFKVMNILDDLSMNIITLIETRYAKGRSLIAVELVYVQALKNIIISFGRNGHLYPPILKYLGKIKTWAELFCEVYNKELGSELIKDVDKAFEHIEIHFGGLNIFKIYGRDFSLFDGRSTIDDDKRPLSQGDDSQRSYRFNPIGEINFYSCISIF
ncbi:MAG: hypothetical protein ABIA04_15940 [Pseudomonadota bacterium]